MVKKCRLAIISPSHTLSSLTVASSADIPFRSGSVSSLQPGFHAVTGCTFHTEVASGAGARVTKYYKGPNWSTALRRMGHADLLLSNEEGFLEQRPRLVEPTQIPVDVANRSQ